VAIADPSADILTRESMIDTSRNKQKVQAHDAAPGLCWICNVNQADSREHKTKRSDLLAVLGEPTRPELFYHHDLERHNRPVQSLDAKILKSPIRICSHCNTTRTQPHDRAWEHMSDWLRNRRPALSVSRFVRGNRIFPYDTRKHLRHVHLYFIKLFGCMLCEAKANGFDLPIDIAPFSNAIMSIRPHPEVYLQIGKCDGTVGRSNLHCWKTEAGSVLAGWLYELDPIAVSVMFARAGKWQPSLDTWHPRTGSNRFPIFDFQYKKRGTGQHEVVSDATC
jgi:hypothetical protein